VTEVCVLSLHLVLFSKKKTGSKKKDMFKEKRKLVQIIKTRGRGNSEVAHLIRSEAHLSQFGTKPKQNQFSD